MRLAAPTKQFAQSQGYAARSSLTGILLTPRPLPGLAPRSAYAGFESSHVARAPSGGSTTDLRSTLTTQKLGSSRVAQAPSGGGTTGLQATSTARKTLAGVGSTREARATPLDDSTSAGPPGLSRAVIPLMIEGIFANALIDTGSTDSCVDFRLVQKHGCPILGTKRRIFMASQGLWLSTKGECRLKLVIKGRMFPDVHLMVLPALCAEVLLGHYFLQRHGCLEMEFGGADTLAVCALAGMEIEPLSLFPNMTTDCTPVAVKSRRYSRADTQFIAEETAQLLKEGIIEPSRSPWRAQFLVVRTESHRKRMVIDYS
uniref:uncharacterized protein n=1 Tax=Myxine glutinosa TaxID=7769 RepID=UPI00358E8661